jgi:hypothetical protein
LERAGFYRIRFANGHDAEVGVNPDRLESDLQPMPADLQQLWTASTVGGRPQVASRPTVERPLGAVGLWWYVVLLTLLVAFAETALASNYLGTQREEA